MEVVRRDLQQRELAYNVMCQRMSGLAETIPAFEVTWSEIPPLGFTFQHAHHGYEAFVVTVGMVKIEVAGDTYGLHVGDVLGVKPFIPHKIINPSKTDTVTLCALHSVYPYRQRHPKKLRIMSPPLTTNGRLHSGHLAGPYLAANILEHYSRLNSTIVTHIGRWIK